MAIRRRSKNEDDEDDDRPRRRIADDDAPATKRRRPLPDEEDDEPPRKRRKSRDEEDDLPPPRRKPRVDDEEDRAPARKRRPPVDDDSDEFDGTDDKTEKSYEEQLREFNRKKAHRIKQFTDLSEGLTLFRKQIKFTLVGTGATVGAFVGAFAMAWFYFVPGTLPTTKAQAWAALTSLVMVLPGLVLAAVLVAVPVLAIMAVNKCKQGPAKSRSGNSLTLIFIVSLGSLVLIWLTSILQSIYFRNLARYLKDKEQHQAANSALMQHVFVGVVGWLVIAGAAYFLLLMETLGILILLVLNALQLLLVIRAYVEMMSVTNGLQNAIARKIKAEEVVEW